VRHGHGLIPLYHIDDTGYATKYRLLNLTIRTIQAQLADWLYPIVLHRVMLKVDSGIEPLAPVDKYLFDDPYLVVLLAGWSWLN